MRTSQNVSLKDIFNNQLRGKDMKKMKMIFVLMVAFGFAGLSNVQASEEQVTADGLVSKSATIVQAFAADPDLSWFREKVKDAKALLIIPQNLKGAFLVGGSGGSGVLVVQDEKTGTWGYPAFYTLGAVSFGIQIGAESSEVILMVMTDRGMESLLTSSVKLGGDVTLAAGPVGGGATAKTADILSYSRSKGAFAGLSVDGSVVKTKDDLNKAYYGKEVSPTDILIRKTVTNPQADDLRAEVAKITKK